SSAGADQARHGHQPQHCEGARARRAPDAAHPRRRGDRMMRRRKFITLLGGAAAAWPFDARTQQSDRVRRIGVLINTVDNDPDAIARLSALQKALREFGWDEGRNLQIDTRWGVDDDRIRRNAAELIALAPDVILANGPPPAMALQQATRSVPRRLKGRSTIRSRPQSR